MIDTPEMALNVSSPYKVLEGTIAVLECAVIAANPNISITWRWFRTESPYDVLSYKQIFTIPQIQRNMSGPYNCLASNSVGTSEAAVIIVDVQCKLIKFKYYLNNVCCLFLHFF